MISIKSQREIELMKIAGSCVAKVHKKVKEVLRPGLTTYELDQICEKVILDNNCSPSFKNLYGFPASCCISVNDTLIHGIPDNTVLKNGDIVSVDVGACYQGYHGDSAWSYIVGKSEDPEVNKLMEVTEKALYLGIEKAIPGNKIGDIANAIQNYVEENGFSIPHEYTGHGIGRQVHEDPMVPNIGKPNTLETLKKGMCIAIEPMVFIGSNKCKTLKDGWTVKSKDGKYSAHFEHTIAIVEDGNIILTKE